MSYCDDAENAGLAKIFQAVSPILNQTAGIIQKMQEKGLDPRKWYDIKNDAVVDWIKFLEDTATMKNEQDAKLKDEIRKNCRQVQEYVDEMVAYALSCFTRGLSELLPKQMTHVDIGEILNGKPLGGDGSVFNQIRDDLFFTHIGIDPASAIGKAVSDPFHGSNLKDGINQLLENWGVPVRL